MHIRNVEPTDDYNKIAFNTIELTGPDVDTTLIFSGRGNDGNLIVWTLFGADTVFEKRTLYYPQFDTLYYEILY